MDAFHYRSIDSHTPYIEFKNDDFFRNYNCVQNIIVYLNIYITNVGSSDAVYRVSYLHYLSYRVGVTDFCGFESLQSMLSRNILDGINSL